MSDGRESAVQQESRDVGLNLEAKPAAKPLAAAPVPVAVLPVFPPNTLPALLAPPPIPETTRAAIIISMAMLEPVWATFKPNEDR